MTSFFESLLTFGQSRAPQAMVESNWLYSWIIVFGLMVGLVAFAYGTRAGIIARATTKEAIRQPLFFLLLFICAFVLVLNTFMPFFTMENDQRYAVESGDVKMLKECGLATILIAGAFLAVWTAGTSITSEIEGKTAMTLLSKPINRRQFVLGKYVGILQAATWLFLVLGVILCCCVFYKVGYDQREGSQEETPLLEWSEVGGVELPLPHPDRMGVVYALLPGMALAFMQVTVLAAIAVTIATRLPIVVNLVSCFAIFVVGNLAPLLVQRSETAIGNEYVTFTARLIATVLPSLESFNTSAALESGKSVPQDYLGISLIYAASYATAVILLGFILFEDRDLA
jgi:F0F1-type ATP synthase membrane subunit c/vacuolar-type H+-ATPase subunit K